MKIYVVCTAHKEVLCIGQTFDYDIKHHAVDQNALWDAFSKFVISHCHCGCQIVAEKEFYDMDLDGYKRKDNAYGIPFKGPEEL